jgi:PPOX class probable F420-dependent enzyme
MATTTMTRAEREAFLAGLHVGVLSVAGNDGEAPLQAPIWYAYEPGGEVRFTTGANSAKVRRLRATGHASLCAQTETAPYAYVIIEGPVVIEELDFERDARPIAVRYLGERGAAAYLRGTTPESARENSVLVRLQPTAWHTTDYGKA